MYNPEKLAKQCTQDEEKQIKTQYVLYTKIHKQTHTHTQPTQDSIMMACVEGTGVLLQLQGRK